MIDMVYAKFCMLMHHNFTLQWWLKY